MNNSTADMTYNLGSLSQWLLGFVIIAMCITAVTGNLLVIIIIAATTHFHSVTSIFLINLAVSDFLVGIGVMPLVATSVIYNRWINHQFLCLYMGYASVVYCTSSVLTLAAIAVDRYRAIVNCFRYNSQTTMKRAVSTVMWIWAQAAFSGLPPFLGWGHFEYFPVTFSCSANWAYSPSYTGLVMVCSFLLPTCTMVFCYISIVQVIRDHARRIHNIECQLQKNVKANTVFLKEEEHTRPSIKSKKISPERITDDSQNSVNSSHAPIDSKKHDIFAQYNSPGREHNGTIRLFLVIFIFFFCWVPYIIVSMLQPITTKRNQWKLPPELLTASAWLALLNSAINPLLYALLSKRFRKALCNLKQKMVLKMDYLLRDISILGNTGSTKSKIRKIHLLKPVSHTNQSENKLNRRSMSIFSIASFADTGQEEDVNIPVQFSGTLTPTIWGPQIFSRSSDLLQRETHGKQYLEVPCLPFQPLNPWQLQEEDNDNSSVFVYGKITIKVNEGNSVSP
ncbi:hypothetical protein XENTR_v10021856 [Xenopus tropicalis]|nr:5-hydroxytryptamine receptor 1B [Xenopus tropicalis]KAE8587074.1 hypothetical protein XENTR_v10021856 [Xenopus tropicalis]